MAGLPSSVQGGEVMGSCAGGVRGAGGGGMAVLPSSVLGGQWAVALGAPLICRHAPHPPASLWGAPCMVLHRLKGQRPCWRRTAASPACLRRLPAVDISVEYEVWTAA